jgi:hypothetical protein
MCATRAHLGSHLNNKKETKLPIVFVFIPFWVFVSSRWESKNVKESHFCLFIPTLLIHLFPSAVDLSRPCYLGILTPEGERSTGSINCSTVDGGIDCRSRHRCRCCIAQNPRLRVFRFG